MNLKLGATKPNGTPHQSWTGEAVSRSAEWLVVYTPPGTSVRHHTKDVTYVMEHGNLGIFSAKEYFNVFIAYNHDGSFRHLYINVARPAIWNDSEVSWVDLDLDVMLMVGKKPELLDEDEFAEAKASGQLSSTLADKAEQVASMLMTESARGKFPFLTVGYEDALKEIEKL